MIRTILKPLSFIPALVLMYMIFSFSSQSGDTSSQLSFKISCKIVEAGDYVFDANLDQYQIEEWANKINFITRKLAHMAEYFALAVAVSFPLYVYGMHGILLMLTAGIICVGFAVGDEYHQSFVSGRTPAARDVAIDSIGIFFGIIIVRIIGWTGRKTIFRPRPKKVKKKAKKIKQPNQMYQQNINHQQDSGYQQPPYQGGYQQGPPNQNQYYDNGPGYSQGYPYQNPPPGQYQQPPYQNPPHGQYQNPPYQNSPQGQYQQPPYQNPEYTDDPFVNPQFSGQPNQGQPPYQGQDPYAQGQPPYQGQDPYAQGQPPYQGQDPYAQGQAPYQEMNDPYQDPNFHIKPPEEAAWDGISFENEKPKKKQKKKKDKDWFFDL